MHHKNSFDLLRLVAATMVLYSHQYALLGLHEPQFMGWTTIGTLGVAIFFYLSGFLVWSSWERDPHAGRFFMRRSLRIFPALWVVCLLSVFVLGPLICIFPVGEYFGLPATWRYLATMVLVSTNKLPGIFVGNPFSQVVNGSLWTLPLEFLCYITVAVVGLVCLARKAPRGVILSLCLLGFVLWARLGPQGMRERFAPHFEMVAIFWWGVIYGACLKPPVERRNLVVVAVVLLTYATLGGSSFEWAVLLVCVSSLVYLAGRISIGSLITDAIGDLSYGVYILAFPVQQMGVQWGRAYGWSMATYFAFSLSITFWLAFLSWHGVEKRALRFKPRTTGAV